MPRKQERPKRTIKLTEPVAVSEPLPTASRSNLSFAIKLYVILAFVANFMASWVHLLVEHHGDTLPAFWLRVHTATVGVANGLIWPLSLLVYFPRFLGETWYHVFLAHFLDE